CDCYNQLGTNFNVPVLVMRTNHRNSLLSLRIHRRPRPTLFPYTTLFRSEHDTRGRAAVAAARREHHGVRIRLHPRRPGLVEPARSEEHTSELQSRRDLVCRLLLEKKKINELPAKGKFTMNEVSPRNKKQM